MVVTTSAEIQPPPSSQGTFCSTQPDLSQASCASADYSDAESGVQLLSQGSEAIDNPPTETCPSVCVSRSTVITTAEIQPPPSSQGTFCSTQPDLSQGSCASAGHSDVESGVQPISQGSVAIDKSHTASTRIDFGDTPHKRKASSPVPNERKYQ